MIGTEDDIDRWRNTVKRGLKVGPGEAPPPGMSVDEREVQKRIDWFREEDAERSTSLFIYRSCFRVPAYIAPVTRGVIH